MSVSNETGDTGVPPPRWARESKRPIRPQRGSPGHPLCQCDFFLDPSHGRKKISSRTPQRSADWIGLAAAEPGWRLLDFVPKVAADQRRLRIDDEQATLGFANPAPSPANATPHEASPTRRPLHTETRRMENASDQIEYDISNGRVQAEKRRRMGGIFKGRNCPGPKAGWPTQAGQSPWSVGLQTRWRPSVASGAGMREKGDIPNY